MFARFPFAKKYLAENELELLEIQAAIAATGEGYSFPTNLDNDPPKGGLAPETQQAFLMRAIESQMDEREFENYLKSMEIKKRHNVYSFKCYDNIELKKKLNTLLAAFLKDLA